MDRQGIPLPERVDTLGREFKQLKATVDKLPKEAKVINMDWSGIKPYIAGGFVILVGSLFGAFALHTCSVKGVEQARIAAEHTENHEAREAEQAARQAEIQRQEAEHQRTIAAEQQEVGRGVCERACAAIHAEVIRPEPCMCGGNGQLTLFSEDYSTLTRVQEVDRLQPPPAPSTETGEQPSE